MQLLTINSKMARSSGLVYNFAIPAFRSKDGFKTCPSAKACVAGCYARQGAYRFSNVANALEERLKVTRGPDFVESMSKEISNKVKRSKGKQVFIRIHDSGDFYNKVYTKKWFKIALRFSEVKFYAYTKQVDMFKDFEPLIPSNLKLVFSYGGKQDKLINRRKDSFSYVFKDHVDLKQSGYIDASHDDLKIFDGRKIGLAYHGNKNYSNTKWGEV